jgi:8-amino-7-oxononanoate synthase
VPVVIGDPSASLDLSERVAERGFLVPAIRPPTVPEGTSRLRVVASARHTDKEVDGLILAFHEARS